MENGAKEATLRNRSSRVPKRGRAGMSAMSDWTKKAVDCRKDEVLALKQMGEWAVVSCRLSQWNRIGRGGFHLQSSCSQDAPAVCRVAPAIRQPLRNPDADRGRCVWVRLAAVTTVGFQLNYCMEINRRSGRKKTPTIQCIHGHSIPSPYDHPSVGSSSSSSFRRCHASAILAVSSTTSRDDSPGTDLSNLVVSMTTSTAVLNPSPRCSRDRRARARPRPVQRRQPARHFAITAVTPISFLKDIHRRKIAKQRSSPECPILATDRRSDTHYKDHLEPVFNCRTILHLLHTHTLGSHSLAIISTCGGQESQPAQNVAE
ncbi:hypothetical protein ABEF93_005930 [Exophiala dermatitidis]